MSQSHQEQEPQAERDHRFPLWTVLPWTLLAATLLLLLPRVFHSRPAPQPSSLASRPSLASHPSPAASQPPAAAAPAGIPSAATPPASVPAASGSQSPAAAPVPVSAASPPLTVTLYSAGGSKHISVGRPVMISAYASLPPGQSATLAISYAQNNGPRTLLSLAQGSLSSAAWTPSAPGRYKFTASALDSRKNGAFSHSLIISVDAPPAPPKPAPPKPAPPKPAPPKPALVAAVPAAKPAPARIASRPSPPKPSAPKLTAPKLTAPKMPHKAPAPPVAPHPSPYHVAAAGFKVRAVASTLAGALRRRGFNAFVRPTAKGQGPKMYQVEIGDYVHLDDAQKQVSLLKRDGYPAYLFRSH